MGSSTDISQGDRFDIASFVGHYKAVQILCSPLRKTFLLLKNIYEFKFPKFTYTLWLFFLIVSLLPEGCIIILLQLVIFLCASCGYFHHRTNLFKKLFPGYRYSLNFINRKKDYDPSDTIKEFRISLIEIDQDIILACDVLHSFYSILKWDDPKVSLRLTLSLSAFSLSIFFCGFCLSVFFALSAFLVSMYKYNNFIPKPTVPEFPKEEFGEVDVAASREDISDEPLPNYDCDDKKATLDPKFEHIASSSNMTAINTAEKQNIIKGFLKRRRHKNVETCSACHTQLTSFLKRRHVCVNCGQIFCNKCRTLQVPKSVLGVTAPSTCNDLVPVCFSCHQSLFPV